MLARFLRLRPAKFSRAAEPLEAMDWLHSVNKDLVTTSCTDAEKVRFAAHLLEGPAASWWDTYQITHPVEGVTWDSFQEGFRAAHISAGVMSLKKKEFRDLKQKYRSMSEYIDEFTNLSRYAPDDIDTDAKRKEKFLEGLNDELSIPLSVTYTPTFQSLLDQAITLESKIKQSKAEKGSTIVPNITSMCKSATCMMTMEDLDLTSMGMVTIAMAITTIIMVNKREMDMTMMATKTITKTMEVATTIEVATLMEATMV
jgi:hypothetical protein